MNELSENKGIGRKNTREDGDGDGDGMNEWKEDEIIIK